MTTHVEIVALNWTYFSMFSLTDVKPTSHPLDHDSPSMQQANNEDDIKHIQISDLSSATPTCTAFLIVFEYIIFSTCQLTIS